MRVEVGRRARAAGRAPAGRRARGTPALENGGRQAGASARRPAVCGRRPSFGGSGAGADDRRLTTDGTEAQAGTQMRFMHLRARSEQGLRQADAARPQPLHVLALLPVDVECWRRRSSPGRPAEERGASSSSLADQTHVENRQTTQSCRPEELDSGVVTFG